MQKLLVKNAAVLTVTSIILRIAGIFLRVWLTGKIGAEGMGLYGLIVSVYVLASTFASTGICTAVTRVVAELPEKHGASAKKVVKKGSYLCVFIALISGVILYFSAQKIAQNIICDTRSLTALKVLSIGLPFMGIASCIRGYFIAIKNTVFPSFAQLSEQAVRIIFVVLLVGNFSSYGLSVTLIALVLGDAFAEAVGCIILYIGYKKSLHITAKQKYPVTKKLVKISFPITLGRYIHTFLRTAENMLVPIKIGTFTGSKSLGISQFGMLKGMAMPILFFPASFLNAFSTLLIPEISESMVQGRYFKVQRATVKAVGITVTASVAIGGIFFAVGGNIGELLYNSKDTGVIITALSPIVPFMYLESICDGILKGLNQQNHSFFYGLADSVSRIALIYFFVGKYGMSAFILIMVYSNLLTSLLNLNRLLKVTNTKPDFKEWLIYPLFSVAVAATIGYFIKTKIKNIIASTLIGGGAVAVIYVVLLCFLSNENYFKKVRV